MIAKISVGNHITHHITVVVVSGSRVLTLYWVRSSKSANSDPFPGNKSGKCHHTAPYNTIMTLFVPLFRTAHVMLHVLCTKIPKFVNTNNSYCNYNLIVLCHKSRQSTIGERPWKPLTQHFPLRQFRETDRHIETEKRT